MQSEATTPAEDPSFSLLGDLAGELEWEAALAGVAAVPENVDLTVDLTADERLELRRLLDEAMAGKGV